MLTIFQPRADGGTVKEWKIDRDKLLDWGVFTVRAAAQAAFNGEGEFIPGKPKRCNTRCFGFKSRVQSSKKCRVSVRFTGVTRENEWHSDIVTVTQAGNSISQLSATTSGTAN